MEEPSSGAGRRKGNLKNGTGKGMKGASMRIGKKGGVEGPKMGRKRTQDELTEQPMAKAPRLRNDVLLKSGRPAGTTRITKSVRWESDGDAETGNVQEVAPRAVQKRQCKKERQVMGKMPGSSEGSVETDGEGGTGEGMDSERDGDTDGASQSDEGEGVGESSEHNSEAHALNDNEAAGRRRGKEKGKIVQKKEGRSTEGPQFRTKCSPRKIHLAFENLTDEREAELRKMGFGSLLSVACGRMYLVGLAKLVDQVDPNLGRMQASSGTLELTAEAVGQTLDIPHSNGRCVPRKRNVQRSVLWRYRNCIKQRKDDIPLTAVLKNVRSPHTPLL